MDDDAISYGAVNFKPSGIIMTR